jgi:hypothetical protein
MKNLCHCAKRCLQVVAYKVKAEARSHQPLASLTVSLHVIVWDDVRERPSRGLIGRPRFLVKRLAASIRTSTLTERTSSIEL